MFACCESKNAWLVLWVVICKCLICCLHLLHVALLNKTAGANDDWWALNAFAMAFDKTSKWFDEFEGRTIATCGLDHHVIPASEDRTLKGLWLVNAGRVVSYPGLDVHRCSWVFHVDMGIERFCIAKPLDVLCNVWIWFVLKLDECLKLRVSCIIHQVFAGSSIICIETVPMTLLNFSLRCNNYWHEVFGSRNLSFWFTITATHSNLKFDFCN